MNGTFSLSKMYRDLYKKFNVKKNDELISFFKSRRIDTNICLNCLDTKDKGYQYVDHVKDYDSIVCEECYKSVVSKFKNINVIIFQGRIAYCDCGDPNSIDKKFFCDKHKGNGSLTELKKYIEEDFKKEYDDFSSSFRSIISMLNFMLVTNGDQLVSDNSNEDNNNSANEEDSNETKERNDTSNESDDSVSDLRSTLSLSDEPLDDKDVFIKKNETIQFPEFTKENFKSLNQKEIDDMLDSIILFFLDICSKSLNYPIILLIGEVLSTPQKNVTTSHVCFSTSDNKVIIDNRKDHNCICSTILNLIRYTHVFTCRLQCFKKGLFHQFFFTMSKCDAFKKELMFAFCNFFSNYLNKYQKFITGNLFFITEESQNLVFFDGFIEKFFDSIHILLQDKSNWKIEKSISYNILTIVSNILIFKRTESALLNTKVYEKIIDWLLVFQYSKIFVKGISTKKEDGYCNGDYFYSELYLLQLFSIFAKKLNYKEEEQIKGLIKYIYQRILPLKEDEYSFNITLQRALSMIINRYTLHSVINNNEKFNSKLKKIFDFLSNSNSDEILNKILIPIFKCVNFCNSKKEFSRYHFLEYYYENYFFYFDIFYLCDMNMIKYCVNYFSFIDKKISFEEYYKYLEGNKNFEFFFKSIYNEEIVLQLLQISYSFNITSLPFEKDPLINKIEEKHASNLKENFLIQLNQIILSRDNFIDLESIFDYLPFYARFYRNKIEEVINQNFQIKATIDDKIRCSTQKIHIYDTFYLLIEGLKKGIKKHVEVNGLSIIESLGPLVYKFISGDVRQVYSEENFNFLQKIAGQSENIGTRIMATKIKVIFLGQNDSLNINIDDLTNFNQEDQQIIQYYNKKKNEYINKKECEKNKHKCIFCNSTLSINEEKHGYLGKLIFDNYIMLLKLQKLSNKLQEDKYKSLKEYQKEHHFLNTNYRLIKEFSYSHIKCAKEQLHESKFNIFLPLSIKNYDSNSTLSIMKYIKMFNTNKFTGLLNEKTRNEEEEADFFLQNLSAIFEKNGSQGKKLKITSKYSKESKMFFDLIIQSKNPKEKKEIIFFLYFFILGMKYKVEKNENKEKELFINKFNMLLMNFSSFFNELNIVKSLESDCIIASLLIELCFLSLIIFPFKENFNTILDLLFVKVLPILLIQFYIFKNSKPTIIPNLKDIFSEEACLKFYTVQNNIKEINKFSYQNYYYIIDICKSFIRCDGSLIQSLSLTENLDIVTLVNKINNNSIKDLLSAIFTYTQDDLLGFFFNNQQEFFTKILKEYLKVKIQTNEKNIRFSNSLLLLNEDLNFTFTLGLKKEQRDKVNCLLCNSEISDMESHSGDCGKGTCIFRTKEKFLVFYDNKKQCELSINKNNEEKIKDFYNTLNQI